MCTGVVWPHGEGVGCSASSWMSGEHWRGHHLQSVGPPGTVCEHSGGPPGEEHMESCR